MWVHVRIWDLYVCIILEKHRWIIVNHSMDFSQAGTDWWCSNVVNFRHLTVKRLNFQNQDHIKRLLERVVVSCLTFKYEIHLWSLCMFNLQTGQLQLIWQLMNVSFECILKFETKPWYLCFFFRNFFFFMIISICGNFIFSCFVFRNDYQPSESSLIDPSNLWYRWIVHMNR